MVVLGIPIVDARRPTLEGTGGLYSADPTEAFRTAFAGTEGSAAGESSDPDSDAVYSSSVLAEPDESDEPAVSPSWARW